MLLSGIIAELSKAVRNRGRLHQERVTVSRGGKPFQMMVWKKNDDAREDEHTAKVGAIVTHANALFEDSHISGVKAEPKKETEPKPETKVEAEKPAVKVAEEKPAEKPEAPKGTHMDRLKAKLATYGETGKALQTQVDEDRLYFSTRQVLLALNGLSDDHVLSAGMQFSATLKAAKDLGIEIPKVLPNTAEEFTDAINEGDKPNISRGLRRTVESYSKNVKALYDRVVKAVDAIAEEHQSSIEKDRDERFKSAKDPDVFINFDVIDKKGATDGVRNIEFNGKDIAREFPVGDQNQRGAVRGVHISKDNKLVATDVKAMVILTLNQAESASLRDKAKVPDGESGTISASGEKIDNTYPQFEQVIPKPESKVIVNWGGEYSALKKKIDMLKTMAKTTASQIEDLVKQNNPDTPIEYIRDHIKQALKSGDIRRLPTVDADEKVRAELVKLVARHVALSSPPLVISKRASNGELSFEVLDPIHPEVKRLTEKVVENSVLTDAAVPKILGDVYGRVVAFDWKVLQKPMKVMAKYRPQAGNGTWSGGDMRDTKDSMRAHGFASKDGTTHMIVMPRKVGTSHFK